MPGSDTIGHSYDKDLSLVELILSSLANASYKEKSVFFLEASAKVLLGIKYLKEVS